MEVMSIMGGATLNGKFHFKFPFCFFRISPITKAFQKLDKDDNVPLGLMLHSTFTGDSKMCNNYVKQALPRWIKQPLCQP